MTPMQRTLALLRDQGWHVEIVERWIPGARIRRDLFTFLDLVGLRGGETLGVQVTSGSNVSARIRKIEESPLLADVRRAGWRIEIHGWRRSATGRWTCRIVDLS